VVFSTPLVILRERFKRGGEAPSLKITSPFPFRGRGIKGDGVTI
jgi:hypothetical protein